MITRVVDWAMLRDRVGVAKKHVQDEEGFPRATPTDVCDYVIHMCAS
jgi:hypothetical protein